MELLGLTLQQIQAPTSQEVAHFALVMFPSESEAISKTGTQDETVVIDNSAIAFLNPVLVELVSRGRTLPTEPIVDLDYVDYNALFLKVCRRLGLTMVLSQGRHSGASIDRACNRRSPQGVQRMGRWKAAASVRRYEQMGMLNAS
jgi:hypothetical protein